MQRKSVSKNISGLQRPAPGGGKGKGKNFPVIPAARIQRIASTTPGKPQQPKRVSMVEKPRVSTGAITESKLAFGQRRLTLINGRHASIVVAKDGHLNGPPQVQNKPGTTVQAAGMTKPTVSKGKVPAIQQGTTPGKVVQNVGAQGKQVAAPPKPAPLPVLAPTPGKVVHAGSQGKFPVARQGSHGKVPFTFPANPKPILKDGQNVNAAFKDIKDDDKPAGVVSDIRNQPVSPVVPKEVDRPRVEFKTVDQTGGDKLYVDVISFKAQSAASSESMDPSGTDSEREAKAKKTRGTEIVKEKRSFCGELRLFCEENPTCYRLKPNYPDVCPRCNDGHFKAMWTPLSVFCFVCVPLLGIPCCYAFREYTCTNCGEIWEYDDPREEIPTS